MMDLFSKFLFFFFHSSELCSILQAGLYLRVFPVLPSFFSVDIQPLVTSAFSSIYVMPSVYDAAVAAARRAERTAQTEATQSTQKPESPWSPRDAGKPMSVSGDLLDISEEAKQFATSPKDSAIAIQQENSVATDTEKTSSTAPLESSELTTEEQQEVTELQARDAEVRAHEAAHLAAAGAFATSGASYTYETGPDGKKYAVGGEVSISTSPVKDDPQATLEKAQTIQRAALAPAQPSDQDRKVAATAAQMAAQAQRELAQQNPAESQAAEDTEQAGSAFQLVREAASDSASTRSVSSPSAYYAAHSRMSSDYGVAKFSAYA